MYDGKGGIRHGDIEKKGNFMYKNVDYLMPEGGRDMLRIAICDE